LERGVSLDRLHSLEEALNSLAASAALIDPESAPAVAALSDSLAGWLGEAAPDLAGSEPLLAMAQRVAEGLRRGFAPAEGMERLNHLFARAQQLLAQALGGRDAGAGPASPAASPAAEEPAFIPVGEDDKDSWRDFLIEGPELLQAVETHLVGTLRHEAFNPMEVLRPLHTLKGVCGMLGLEGLNRLTHACEDLLQPHKQVAEKVPAEGTLLIETTYVKRPLWRRPCVDEKTAKS
jgi:HPt (histidine-containing phosphotransfer) domain-containing protein